MKLANTLTLVSITALLSTGALAATAVSVKSLPNGGQVTLSGTVEDFNSEHSFTLRDSSGTVKVDLSSTKSIVLQNGEKVDVTGVVNKGILETDVTANNVSEDKGVGQQVGEAIDSVTGQDAASSAQVARIQSLPDSGLVKINGTVGSVDSAKKFTLNDATGNINVTIKSGESASLTKGTPVTVVGYVDKGLLGKSINATEVDVRSQ